MGKPVTAHLNKDAYLIPGKSGYVRCSFLRTLKYQHTDLKERYARKSVFAFAPVTTPTEAYVSSNYDGKEEIFKVKIADLQTPGPNKTRTQYIPPADKQPYICDCSSCKRLEAMQH